MWYHTIFVFLYLTDFTCIIPSWSIHVVANAKFYTFLWLSSVLLCIYTLST